MDCRRVRHYLPLMASPSFVAGDLELRAAQDHLRDCPACQSILRDEQADDAAISQRICDVPVPAGLTRRLLDRAATNLSQPAANRSWFGHRQRRAMFAAGMILLGICLIPLVVRALRPPTIDFSQLWAVIEQTRVDDDWPVTAPVAWPAGWSAVDNLSVEEVRRLPDSPTRVTAAKFHFVPRASLPPVSGTLWMIDAQRLSSVVTLPPLDHVSVKYSPDEARLIWLENGTVFMLAAPTEDAAGLHLLLAKLLRSRSLA